jgi:folate-dependent phosphoribosylglycinamide formyltransferase PurN
VLLCSDNPASRIIFHDLQRHFGHVSVVREEPVSQTTLLRRRASRLGLKTVAGQALFRAVVVPWLTVRGRGRVAEIKRQFQLDDRPMPGVQPVSSMNDEQARKLLRDMHPAITVVCGTRILGRETLDALNGPVVNFHAGITPLYRGVHGGYWALVEGRPDLVGSTIHLVDAGIDTGGVIAQTTFEVTAADSFATYPYLHVAAALPPLRDAVRQALAGEVLDGRPLRSDLESKLRTHPTLAEYVRHARAGVR